MYLSVGVKRKVQNFKFNSWQWIDSLGSNKADTTPRPILNFAPRGANFDPQGRSCPPGVNFVIPRGWNYLFSLHSSRWGWTKGWTWGTSLPQGQASSLGANHVVKTGLRHFHLIQKCWWFMYFHVFVSCLLVGNEDVIEQWVSRQRVLDKGSSGGSAAECLRK
jgi:hypothetical protein